MCSWFSWRAFLGVGTSLPRDKVCSAQPEMACCWESGAGRFLFVLLLQRSCGSAAVQLVGVIFLLSFSFCGGLFLL